MRPLTIAKFLGCWACVVAAVVLLLLERQPVALPGVLALIAIAFAQAPTTW